MLLRALVRARDRGWEVHAVFGPDSRTQPWIDDFEKAVIPVTFVPSGRRRDGAAAFAKLVAAEDAIVHTSFTGFDLAAATAASPTTAVIWHVQSEARYDMVGRVRNVAKYAGAGRRVARVLCVAPDLTATVRRRGAGRRALFFPNGIDVDSFPIPDGGRRAASRAGLGIDGGSRVLLHLGWDWDRKGGELFLDTVLKLRHADPTIIGLSVGAADRAATGARARGIADGIVALPYGVDARTLYAAADLLIAPSRAEGTPFAVAEALASGIGVVASPISGHNFILEGVPGSRIEPLTPEDFADGIEALLSRAPRTAADHARLGRSIAYQRLDLGAWCDRLFTIYDEVLAERSARNSR